MEQTEARMVTEHIRQDADGVYRWTYEVPMLKNPTILITVWKVLGISFGVVYLFSAIVSLCSGTTGDWEAFWSLTKGFLILILVFLVISVIAYLIVAATYGWKYVVDFEMDEEQIVHIQTPKQNQKAQKLAAATVIVGALARRPSTVGAGVLAGSRSTSTSMFESVRYIKVRRRRNVIHVNQLLDKNQVYADDADFDFVESFILEHCVNAKVLSRR